ncbi:hypothetical protein RP20_CCG007541 [Aedes albopictus]|nr:hypothetical protein RP20_CCG007541 [Aedes albopictus]
MKSLKDQLGLTQVFGPSSSLETISGPQVRKPIHRLGKNRWSKARTSLRSLVDEYCTQSTIHGIGYIGSRRRSILERIWWFGVFVLSVYGCATLIHKVYQKWTNNPVIVTFDERPLPVWMVPFPAVTICPEAKIRANDMNFTEDFYRFINYRGSRKDLDDERIDRLLAVLQICDEFFHARSLKFPELYARTETDFDIVQIMRNISVPLIDIILFCKVNGVRCNELFSETLTDEGICFTFNGFSTYDMFRDGVLHDEYNYLNEPKNLTGWSLESGYVPRKKLESHPIRVLGSGFGAGLTIELLALEDDIEQHCRVQQGFKVIIHPSTEYPQVTKSFALVTYSRDVTIAVRPVIMSTSSELLSYHPTRRHCYFNHERQLKFFRVYTQSNCELECVTNYTLKMCGCVKFSMPRSAKTRICRTSEIACVLSAENRMLLQSAKRRLKKLQTYGSACNCIPGCTSIHYDTEITQSKCDFRKTLELRFAPVDPTISENVKQYQISKLGIYFREVQYITSKRSELFGMIDFISNCGGILGLCLGVSLFSVVELLYYCLVRPLPLIRKALRGGRTVTIVKESSVNRF